MSLSRTLRAFKDSVSGALTGERKLHGLLWYAYDFTLPIDQQDSVVRLDLFATEKDAGRFGMRHMKPIIEDYKLSQQKRQRGLALPAPADKGEYIYSEHKQALDVFELKVSKELFHELTREVDDKSQFKISVPYDPDNTVWRHLYSLCQSAKPETWRYYGFSWYGREEDDIKPMNWLPELPARSAVSVLPTPAPEEAPLPAHDIPRLEAPPEALLASIGQVKGRSGGARPPGP